MEKEKKGRLIMTVILIISITAVFIILMILNPGPPKPVTDGWTLETDGFILMENETHTHETPNQTYTIRLLDTDPGTHTVTLEVTHPANETADTRLRGIIKYELFTYGGTYAIAIRGICDKSAELEIYKHMTLPGRQET